MLHLFNPENDLALASGLEHFTPPKGARAIRHAGQFLPMLWATEGDAILCDRPIDDAMLHYAKRYGLKGMAVEKSHTAHERPAPWGWSLYSRDEFLRKGISPDMMPDRETLERLRMLSHRRTSIEINRALGISPDLLPTEAHSAEEAKDAIGRWGDAVIKLPWSSSGRGVIYSSGTSPERLENYISGMIGRQGSVTIEPRLNRMQDFAALFHCDGQRVEYRGLSMFATNEAGFYEGNIVAPQQRLNSRLGLDILPVVRELEKILTGLLVPHYDGWLGIDMMTYLTSDGRKELAPCVEMNLRMTMGVAAMAAAEKAYPVEHSEMLLKVMPDGVSLLRM